MDKIWYRNHAEPTKVEG